MISKALHHFRIERCESNIVTVWIDVASRSMNVFHDSVIGELEIVIGELEQMLDRIANAYDEEIDVSTERLTTILEPLMIIFLAVVVGYIVVSIVLPILEVGQFQ